MKSRKYHVFLSYNSANTNDASEIYDYLSGSGFRVFFDRKCIRSGSAWQREIERALASSDSILVLVGPNGMGPWQETENYAYQIISVGSAKDRLIIPAFLPQAQEPENYPQFLRQYHRFNFDTSVREGLPRLIDSLPKSSEVGEFERPLLEREQDSLLQNTIRAYEKMAEKYFDKWKNNIPPSIHAFLYELEKNTRAGRVLDVGCGPGHHANFIATRGHLVTGIDLCAEFIRIANQNSHTNCKFLHADMRELENTFRERNLFDGVWACASCLHLTKETLYSQLFQFSAVLKPGGVLGLSFQVGMPSVVDEFGRFFERYDEKELVEMIRTHGYRTVIVVTQDTEQNTHDKRQLKRWLNLITIAPAEKERVLLGSETNSRRSN